MPFKPARRRFLKRSGLALGAAALPAWLLEREEARAAAIDKSALADLALSIARKARATYADIRINRYRNESIVAREKQVQAVTRTQSFGFGVRVLLNGAWGFAASRDVTPEAVRRMTARAVDIARANASHQRTPNALLPAAPQRATWKSAFQKDPFDIALEPKIQFLLKLNETALQVKGVSYVDSSVGFVNEQKFYASTDGSAIEQYLIRTFPTFNVTAVDAVRGDYQQRACYASPQAMGYEYLELYPFLAEAEQAGHEALEKLKGKSVVPGKYDLVLHPTHLWLTIHESVGHPTELDRALGWEANFAGTSFLTPDKTGKFQFGSKIVNFFADRTQPHGLATVGYDDEGVPSERWYLVRDGVFVDWQTTRELAARTGKTRPHGCTHAEDWGSVPFARMPNVSLEPSKQRVSLVELLADVKNGILILGDGSFSIDHQRYNFQFGGQTFWEIKDGKQGSMLRDVAYQARTPDFWGACDGLGGEATYELGGALHDGKGEPVQSNAVSHGCPVARFRQIDVLNTAARREGV
jgi:TldD protein